MLGTSISVVFRSFQLILVSISVRGGWVGSWEMIRIIPRTAKIGTIHMAGIGSYLKKHTEALVKDVGIEPAC
jgi:hypothetical protein